MDDGMTKANPDGFFKNLTDGVSNFTILICFFKGCVLSCSRGQGEAACRQGDLRRHT